MFNLIRRLSNGVILRPDRPWADDATSNAPTKGKKRRLSVTERNHGHGSMEESRTKKIRGESDVPETRQPEPEPQQQDEKGVKEVTKGVKDVELNDTSGPGSEEGDEVKPESVPLPGEDDTAELDEGGDGSPASDGGSDDIASSVDGEGVADGPSEPEQPEGQEASEEEKVGEEKTEEAQEVPEPETKKGEAAEPAP